MTDSANRRMARSLFPSHPEFMAEGERSAPEQKSPFAPVSTTQRAIGGGNVAERVPDGKPHVHGARVARPRAIERDGHDVTITFDLDVLVGNHRSLLTRMVHGVAPSNLPPTAEPSR